MDALGSCWKGNFHYEGILVSYFTVIFYTSSPINIAEVCSVVNGKLRPSLISWFESRFSVLEVKEAIYQMHPLKAPSPDGLPALFYQKYSHVDGSDISIMVLEILNNVKDLSAINNTFITLVPKGKNPKTPRDFRPISLCNVIMKIITKTIANRTKKILPRVIDEEQSVFVHGRLIIDNALIAMKCFHWIKKKKKGKKMCHGP